MGEVVSLDAFRNNNKLEEEYLQFLSHVNKFVKIPTNIPELAKCFYFTLRYLEGNINCFTILSLIKNMPPEDVEDLRTQIITYLDGLSNDLQKF